MRIRGDRRRGLRPTVAAYERMEAPRSPDDATRANSPDLFLDIVRSLTVASPRTLLVDGELNVIRTRVASSLHQV